MKKIFFATYLLMAFGMLSCDSLEKDAEKGVPIYVSVSADSNIESQVKSPYLSTVPSANNPLLAKVLVSTTEFEYDDTSDALYPDNGEDGKIAIHSNVTFTGSENQLINGASYNGNAEKQGLVYLCALHPQGAEGNVWNITGTAGEKNYKASFVFSGKEDVMFAPQTIGSYNRQNIPVLNFKHLLTYVKIYIYAETEAISDAWGNITSLKIKNAHDMGDGSNILEVNLSESFLTAESPVTFIPVSDYEAYMYEPVTDNVFPSEEGGFVIPYSSTAPKEESAYVLMAPVNARATDMYDSSLLANEFDIIITAENRQTVVNVDLMKNASDFFVGSTMGKQFSLTLKFTMGNTVAVQAVVTEWKTGGIGIGDVVE